MLAFVVLEQLESGTRIHDVAVSNSGLLSDIINAQVVVGVNQKIHDCFCPIGSVTQQAQVTERLLRATQFAFLLAELIRELDKKFSIAVTLMLRQVSNRVTPHGISLALRGSELKSQRASTALTIT